MDYGQQGCACGMCQINQIAESGQNNKPTKSMLSDIEQAIKLMRPGITQEELTRSMDSLQFNPMDSDALMNLLLLSDQLAPDLRKMIAANQQSGLLSPVTFKEVNMQGFDQIIGALQNFNSGASLTNGGLLTRETPLPVERATNAPTNEPSLGEVYNPNGTTAVYSDDNKAVLLERSDYLISTFVSERLVPDFTKRINATTGINKLTDRLRAIRTSQSRLNKLLSYVTNPKQIVPKTISDEYEFEIYCWFIHRQVATGEISDSKANELGKIAYLAVQERMQEAEENKRKQKEAMQREHQRKVELATAEEVGKRITELAKAGNTKELFIVLGKLKDSVGALL